MILATALDYHRSGDHVQGQAFLQQAYKATAAACLHPNKEWAYGWPLLGISDPDEAQRPAFTASEHAALAAFHRDKDLLAKSLDQAPPKSGGGGGQGGGGGSTPAGGNEADLRAQVEKLKKDLATERKKQKGKGGGKDHEK